MNFSFRMLSTSASQGAQDGKSRCQLLHTEHRPEAVSPHPAAHPMKYSGTPGPHMLGAYLQEEGDDAECHQVGVPDKKLESSVHQAVSIHGLVAVPNLPPLGIRSQGSARRQKAR